MKRVNKRDVDTSVVFSHFCHAFADVEASRSVIDRQVIEVSPIVRAGDAGCPVVVFESDPL
jgi:hypothetical protein